MQKKLIALAVAGLASTGAMAQVTLYGSVDVGVATYRDLTESPTTTRSEDYTSVTSGEGKSNRLGFRGEEDLGNGLTALFLMEAGLQIDTGNAGTTAAAQPANTAFESSQSTAGGSRLFGRQIYAGLKGAALGQLTIGRHYAAGNGVRALADATGGSTAAAADQLFAAGPASWGARLDNSIVYVTPNFAGLTAELNVGNGDENNSNTHVGATSKRNNKATAASLKYSGFGLNAGIAYHRLYNAATASNENTLGTGVSIAANYNFGVATVYAGYQTGKAENVATDAETNKARAYAVGVKVPFMGKHSVAVSYAKFDDRFIGTSGVDLTDNDASNFGVVYKYDLSKRSTLYAGWSRLTNKNNSSFGPNAGGSGLAPTVDAGADPKALQIGMSHTF